MHLRHGSPSAVDGSKAFARLRAALRRGQDESGFALLLALGILVGLGIVVGTVVAYASAGGRETNRSAASQSAYHLAESGVNDALSVISFAGNDVSKMKAPPQYAGDPNSTVTQINGGTVTWGGTFDASHKTWTIKAIGSLRNPTGPSAAPVTRTITETAQEIIPPPYNFVSTNTACDAHTLIIRTSGQLTVTNPMYINSCNSPQDAFDIFGAGGNISAPDIKVVGGWETHNGSTVTINGTNCGLAHSSAPLTNPQPVGCPTTGQPVLADPFAGKLFAPPLGTPACTGTAYGTPVSYSPKQSLNANITAGQTSITSNGTAIQNGAVVIVDSEEMLVTAGGGTTTLTVQRAYNGTTAAAHNKPKEIKNVPVGTGGTAVWPAECHIASGSVTLQPGTYYGGICIGGPAGTDCGSNIGGSCSGGNASVTLAPGTYIMAGGGFFLCGSSSLSAPNVTIYNTQDPSNLTGAGAIDQILLDTTGSVSLGPQTDGPYQGLVMFQDPTLAVAANVACDQKSSYNTAPSQTQINEYDIALMDMASSGANGPLGSISGTIYSPAPRADFADGVSGRANLAVISSCILIDGGSSIFDFHQDGLFGVGFNLSQSG